MHNLKDREESKRSKKEKLKPKLKERDWNKYDSSSVERFRSNGKLIESMTSSIGRKWALPLLLSRINQLKKLLKEELPISCNNLRIKRSYTIRSKGR